MIYPLALNANGLTCKYSCPPTHEAPHAKITKIFHSQKQKQCKPTTNLSICHDAPKNHIRFKEIIDEYKIEWDNCFIPFDAAEGSMVDYLHIESYPSFVLIRKNGDMIFLLSGENNIAKIARLLEHYK